MSILSEIQSRKKSRRTVVFGMIFGILAVMIMLYAWFFASGNKEDISYKTHIISTGSVAETLSGDGKMLYRGYYNLSFPVAGKVAIVHKKDGEKVEKNEAVVSLNDTYLRLNLEKAEIALQNARANLIAKEASAPSQEEIRITEEQFKQASLALENTKRRTNSDMLVAKKSFETALVSFHSAENDLNATENDAKANLQNILNSVVIAEKELQNAENDLHRVLSDGSGNLRDLREKGFIAIDTMTSILVKDLDDMDNLLGVTDANRNKNDAFETYLGAKDSGTKTRAENALRTAKSAFDIFMTDWSWARINPSYEETVYRMDSIYSISILVSNSLAETIAMLRNSISSSSFPEASIDSSITLFDSELSVLNSQNSLFITARQAIVAKETSLATDEKTHRDMINVLASRLDLAKGELEKAKSTANLLIGTSQTKLDLAKKQVESSELQYATVVKQGNDAISTASKQVDIARATLDAKKKRISPEEIAPYQIAIHTAQNAVKEAKQRLQDSVLRSPIDGMVAKIDARIGEEVTIGNPLVSLVDTAHSYIESDMEEIDIAKIRLGQSVRISFDALEGVTLTGSVTFISPSSAIDANGIVTYRVDIDFEPGTTGVREGMSVTVEYIAREAKNVLTVPTNFLSESEGKYSIFSLDRNMSVPVEIGISDGKMTEVKSGVKVGEKVRE